MRGFFFGGFIKNHLQLTTKVFNKQGLALG